MTFEPVEKYPRTRLSDVVAGKVQALIAAGDLVPDERLPAERELAQRLGVSRPSLREALVRLESGGFIRSEGRGGFVVANLATGMVADPMMALLARQPRAAGEVLELWRDLESLAASYAAERASRPEMQRIAEAFLPLLPESGSSATGDAEEHANAFHLAIIDAAHNLALTHIVRALRDVVRWSMPAFTPDAAVAAKLLQQRRDLFEAVEGRHPKRARKAAAAHLDYIIARITPAPAKPR